MRDVAGAVRVVRFGVFEVDLREGELRKKGVRVKLQEQPLQVLALLLERPGQVVTREELRQQLWPGTVVDFDHGLNTTINKLREALGDAADTPRFIETLPRRGYRFVYPVGADWEAGVEPAARRRRLRAAGMALGALAAAFLGLLALDVGGVRGRLTGPPAATGIESIAVLPLRNLSRDPGQDHLADGLTEALITELGKAGGLRVLSYQSVIGYRGTSKPVPRIANELGVDAVLEGAVLHSGERVRITANLVLASPERHLWAESYEFDLRDLLATQRELARDVAGRIRARVDPRREAGLVSPRRVDPEAYEAYLLARAHLSKAPTATSWARARESFEKAIEKDPGFAPALAGLAELQLRHRGSSTEDPGAARREARRWAERALELDDGLADAHTTLARVAQQEWDWAGAEREYRRAIELNPSHAPARIRYAMYLYAMRRFEEAAAEARRAQQLDPASPFVNTWAGAAYWFAGRAEEATASWQKALDLDPAFSDASLALARTHVTEGRQQQAIAELRRALSFDRRQPLILGALAHAYARSGQRDEALKVVGELTRLEAEERGYVARFGMIWACAGLGRKDQAFARLERSFQERTDRMVWIGVDPLLEPLRSDPRFDDLVRRVGLPPRGSAGAR